MFVHCALLQKQIRPCLTLTIWPCLTLALSQKLCRISLTIIQHNNYLPLFQVPSGILEYPRYYLDTTARFGQELQAENNLFTLEYVLFGECYFEKFSLIEYMIEGPNSTSLKFEKPGEGQNRVFCCFWQRRVLATRPCFLPDQKNCS